MTKATGKGKGTLNPTNDRAASCGDVGSQGNYLIMLKHFVDLTESTPIGEGTSQLVFQHPDLQNVVVKVLKTNRPQRTFLKYRNWRYGALKTWHQEVEEYIALLSRVGHYCDRIPRFHGFCETSSGIGVMTEKIYGFDGRLAPSLTQVLQSHELTFEKAQAIRIDVIDLFVTLRGLRINFCDIHCDNLVLGRRGECEKLVVIDGLGSYTLFPIKQFSSFVYGKSMKKRLNNILPVIDKRIAQLRQGNRALKYSNQCS